MIFLVLNQGIRLKQYYAKVSEEVRKLKLALKMYRDNDHAGV